MGIYRDLRPWACVSGLLLTACAAEGGKGLLDWERPVQSDDAGGDVLTDAGPEDQDPDGRDAAVDDERDAEVPLEPEAFPLLGSKHGGHIWADFCKDQPDSAELPADPRRSILPGTNALKAVIFNAPWVSCRDNPTDEQRPPSTCGEYRVRVARADAAMEGGRMTFFGGDQQDALLTFDADSYNDLWKKWGFKSRPKDFDKLVANRWGLPIGNKRNPYPLKGEDPNKTNGGSGQLPTALSQLRDKDGQYTGKIGMNCHWCHSAEVGTPEDGPGLGEVLGSGNPLVEIGSLFGDWWSRFPIAANKVRGTGDILLYPAIAALDLDRLNRLNGSVIASPSQGSVDYPAWWNMGHRTRRFHDGSFAMDDSRPVMGFFMPIATWSNLIDIPNGRKWIEKHEQDVNLWVEAMKSPKYPGPINEALAERGAEIFHTKNLWEHYRGPAPEGGNGSCASCHGVYSKRYANDPNFLEDPSFEGIAAYVAPLEVIGTDGARANSLNKELQETLSYSWWGYGEPDKKGKCFGVHEKPGYLAPPLYGIWASAPYFHNGSVPTVYEVLKPSERPAIWKRMSRLVPSEWPTGSAGFDTDLKRAYDHEKLGWKYETFECGNSSIYSCTKEDPKQVAAGSIWLLWNVDLAPMEWSQLEDRKVYNTYKYSQGNQGHDFVDTLGDDDRWALVEYLKTL